MAEIRWSNRALQDLDAIGAYIERSSPQYARSLVARLYKAGGVLEEFRLLGRVVPEVQSEHIREVIRDGYRIVYVLNQNQIDILAVLHGRQDLGKKAAERVAGELIASLCRTGKQRRAIAFHRA